MVVPAAMTFDLDLAPKAAGAVALLVTGGLIDRLFESGGPSSSSTTATLRRSRSYPSRAPRQSE